MPGGAGHHKMVAGSLLRKSGEKEDQGSAEQCHQQENNGKITGADTGKRGFEYSSKGVLEQWSGGSVGILDWKGENPTTPSLRRGQLYGFPQTHSWARQSAATAADPATAGSVSMGRWRDNCCINKEQDNFKSRL